VTPPLVLWRRVVAAGASGTADACRSDRRTRSGEMFPATTLIPRRNPSSQHETEFSSGTRVVTVQSIIPPRPLPCDHSDLFGQSHHARGPSHTAPSALTRPDDIFGKWATLVAIYGMPMTCGNVGLNAMADASGTGKKSLSSVSVARDEQIIDSPNHVSAGHSLSGMTTRVVGGRMSNHSTPGAVICHGRLTVAGAARSRSLRRPRRRCCARSAAAACGSGARHRD
jgi:hypothetical protein